MSQGLIALILFGSLIIFFLLKVPIAFSLILSSLLVMLLTGTGLEMIPKRLFTSCDSFSFMAASLNGSVPSSTASSAASPAVWALSPSSPVRSLRRSPAPAPPPPRPSAA